LEFTFGWQFLPPPVFAIVAAVEVILRPHLAVGAGAAEIDAAALADVEEERRLPAVHDLTLGIEAGMGVGQEAELVAIFATKGGGEFFIGSESEGGVTFDEEGEIAEGVGHAAEVVLGACAGLGVVFEDDLAGQGIDGREEPGISGAGGSLFQTVSRTM
jgi:hypothetical protein